MVLFIRAAAPNRASLGATTGIAQVALAVGRIVGPASAASLFSYSLQEGHDAWLIYYFLIAIVFLAVGTALLLPRYPNVCEDSQ
jgi:MFS family permease